MLQYGMRTLAHLDCLVHEPPNFTATVVLLHGRGASADDLFSLAEALPPHVRGVFPNAPFPFALSSGFAWWDMPPNQRPGLEKSAPMVTALLTELTLGDPALAARTVLGGFSQGSILTLDVGLRFGPRLAGLACMSGYLFDEARACEGVDPAGSPPVSMLHGTFDDVIPVARAQKARDTLAGRGFDVRYGEYDMGHEITAASWRQVRGFLADVIP
jgi:phospholipase/carboxylesterase